MYSAVEYCRIFFLNNVTQYLLFFDCLCSLVGIRLYQTTSFRVWDHSRDHSRVMAVHIIWWVDDDGVT